MKTVCFVTVHWCQSWGAPCAWCPPTNDPSAAYARIVLYRIVTGKRIQGIQRD